MSLEFLTPEEIYRITKRRRWTAQLKVLRSLGYAARPDGDGAPLVLRSHVEAKFGQPSEGKRRRTQPDFSSLRAEKATH